MAENERILASTFDAAIAAHRDGHLQRIIVVSLVDGLRVGDGLPDARGRAADVAAADLHVRLPEARLRVLRQGRLGAVPAAVHDRPAVQLRRHRRAAGAARHGHHVRQREARPLATSCRTSCSRCSRARTRCTSSATARRSATTPTAATWPTASASRWSPTRRVNEDFNLSTATSTTVMELATAIWHKIHGPDRAVPLRVRPALRARRPAARPGRPQGARDAGLRGDDDPLRDARRGHPLDPGRSGGGTAVTDSERSATSGRPAPELSVVMPVFKEGEAVEPVHPGPRPARRAPHEILVVYDFDEDPTVPVIERLAARAAGRPRPAQRPGARRAQRHEGRDRRPSARLRPHHHVGRLRRAARRRSDGRARPRRRRRRGSPSRYMRGGQPGRRAAASSGS